MKINLEICPHLWFENEDGDKFIPDLTQNMPPYIPSGFIYQHTEFPHVLQHAVFMVREDGSSEKLATGESSFSNDLTTALVRSGDYTVHEAIMVAGKSCERCMNVLAHNYGLEWGYALHSDDWIVCPTQCLFCEDERTTTREERQAAWQRIDAVRPPEIVHGCAEGIEQCLN